MDKITASHIEHRNETRIEATKKNINNPMCANFAFFRVSAIEKKYYLDMYVEKK